MSFTGSVGGYSANHVIITGGNNGIGKATAIELAKKGMSVTIACRNPELGARAASDIRSECSGDASVRSMTCDLASLKSTRQFVDDYKQAGTPLHILINNAGVMACPLSYTEDGFEQQLGVNHLGHFLLTTLLLDLLHSSALETGKPSRVVVVSSAAEKIGNFDFEDLNYTNNRAYNPWLAYGQSKLANCLFSLQLSRHCQTLGLPITCNALHPGIVDTQLIRYVFPQATGNNPSSPFRSVVRKLVGLKSPTEGAETSVFLATSPEVEAISGLYFQDCREAKPSTKARDTNLAEKLWQASKQLTST